MQNIISFYFIPKQLDHDKNKLFCFNWDYEKDKMEIEEEINSYLEKIGVNTDYYGTKDWCYKCKMFRYNFDSPVINKLVISHNKEDPIWLSEWNIRNLHIGSNKKNFARKFCYNRRIREIDENDIISAINDINYYDEVPLRISDKLAYDETIKILNELKNWINKDVFIIIEEKE
jgi:hypothetical protein